MERQRASRWEIAGAWLRIWTPPRDVEIPPPPKRALALAAVLLAAAIAAIVVVAKPAIDRAKAHEAARDAREVRARQAKLRAQLAVAQRVQRGRAPRVARLYAAGDRDAALAALLATARTSVERDARARVASGELTGPVRVVRCSGRERDRGVRVQLDCLAVTAATTHRGVYRVRIGHPFLVGASLRSGRYAWCKDNRRPGEGLIERTVTVELPRACRVP